MFVFNKIAHFFNMYRLSLQITFFKTKQFLCISFNHLNLKKKTVVMFLISFDWSFYYKATDFINEIVTYTTLLFMWCFLWTTFLFILYITFYSLCFVFIKLISLQMLINNRDKDLSLCVKFFLFWILNTHLCLYCFSMSRTHYVFVYWYSSWCCNNIFS